MSQFPPDNSDSQKPADDSSQNQQADNVVQGNQNRVIQGDNNTAIQGDNNVFNKTLNFFLNFTRQNGSESENIRNPVQQKLLKIVNTEVESRINSSLYNRVYVVLDKEQNSSQVECPWEIEVKVGSKPKIRLQNTEITTVFDREEIAGRLLILGQPGAGKTTMLLKLAEELIKRAYDNPTDPVPVLFSLSAWQKDNQTIKDWLVEQLKEKYGVRKDIGKQWVDNQEIIPLLDGLDEIAAERQELCVRKINNFLHPETWSNPLVICSRTEEYQYIATLLQLNNSLKLSPLTPQQVYQYLQSTGNLQFWDSINNNADLNQLAQTPFLLNIIVLSYQKISIETWQQFKTLEERRFYIFDTYVGRMLERPYKGKQSQQKKIEKCLGWLACKLTKENRTEFLIEKMQPYYLETNKRVIYSIVVWAIIITLISEIVINLINHMIFPLANLLISEQTSAIDTKGIFVFIAGYSIFSLVFKLVSGLCLGFINGLYGDLIENKIVNSVILIIPLKFFSKVIIKWLFLGIVSGLSTVFVLVIYIFCTSGFDVLVPALVFGLVYGLVFGLIFGIIFGLIGDEIQPIESLKFNFKKYFYGHNIGFILGSVIGLGYGLRYELTIGFTSAITYGLIIGQIIGFNFGINTIEIENKKKPNQGIWQSIFNTLLLSTSAFIIATLLIFGYLKITFGYTNINKILVTSLVPGLLFGLLIGIARSGTPVIKHFVLRVILWSNGYIPWNYAKFLNYSTNRLFLQRVGGGYRFIHKMLQDHFAQIYDSPRQN